MNGFKSRKFILAFIVVVTGAAAAFGLPAIPAFAWLREHSITIFGAVCALVGAYLASNIIQDWGHKNGA